MPDLHVSIKDWVNFCLMIFIVSKVENVVIRTHFDPKFLFWERKLKVARERARKLAFINMHERFKIST